MTPYARDRLDWLKFAAALACELSRLEPDDAVATAAILLVEAEDRKGARS